MSKFKILTEILSELHFWENSEVEQIIEAHFRMWLTDEIANFTDNAAAKERSHLFERQQSLLMKKHAIEYQLLVGKSKLKDGEPVDKKWLARTRWAGKNTGVELVQIQNRLVEIKAAEKKINIKNALSSDRIMIEFLKQWIFEKMDNPDDFKAKMNEWRAKADAISNTPDFVYEKSN